MARGQTHQPCTMPLLWRTLTTAFEIPDREARWLWHVIWRARWSVVVSLRQAMYLFEARPPAFKSPAEQVSVLRQTIPPAVLMEAFEALHQEGLMSRREANEVEEAVLKCVTKEGVWR